MGVGRRVIKGDPARGRRWIWDKWLFEGNGLWAIARWPRGRVPRCEREHLAAAEAGCANAPVQPPGFRPLLPGALLPPFAPNLWSLFGSFRPRFAPISCLLASPALQELAEVSALSWKMGKQGSLHRENIPSPIEISSSSQFTGFEQTGTLTPEQRRLIRPQLVVWSDRGLST